LGGGWVVLGCFVFFFVFFLVFFFFFLFFGFFLFFFFFFFFFFFGGFFGVGGLGGFFSFFCFFFLFFFFFFFFFFWFSFFFFFFFWFFFFGFFFFFFVFGSVLVVVGGVLGGGVCGVFFVVPHSLIFPLFSSLFPDPAPAVSPLRVRRRCRRLGAREDDFFLILLLPLDPLSVPRLARVERQRPLDRRRDDSADSDHVTVWKKVSPLPNLFLSASVLGGFPVSTSFQALIPAPYLFFFLLSAFSSEGADDSYVADEDSLRKVPKLR